MDILAELVPYLAARLDCPVMTERPEKPPERIVIVRRTGGQGDRFVDRPRVLIHCWDVSDEAAASLCYQVAEFMICAADKITNLTRCMQDSIYQNNLDGKHRWSASFDIVTNR